MSKPTNMIRVPEETYEKILELREQMQQQLPEKLQDSFISLGSVVKTALDHYEEHLKKSEKVF